MKQLATIFTNSANQKLSLLHNMQMKDYIFVLGRGHTLCPNIIVLVVSPRCLGDGPIVTTNDVLAVPMRFNTRLTLIRANKGEWLHFFVKMTIFSPSYANAAMSLLLRNSTIPHDVVRFQESNTVQRLFTCFFPKYVITRFFLVPKYRLVGQVLFFLKRKNELLRSSPFLHHIHSLLASVVV